MSTKKEAVKVIVRCRPLATNEQKEGYRIIVNCLEKRNQIEVKSEIDPQNKNRTYTFDQVYGPDSFQENIYKNAFRPLVASAIEGFNGTIFAYGQTGTGKTFTMEGIKSDPVEKGVIPRSFEQIFNHIETTQTHDSVEQYLVRASYLEIYKEQIKDLLSKDQKKRLELKENPDRGVYVKDLLSFVVKSVKEIEHVMKVGNTNRAVGATDMNEHSSRSHAIFIINIECSSSDGTREKPTIRVGKLNMVDLAGSERQAKTKSQGTRFEEAVKINQSLASLGNVISALVKRQKHIPYRDSQLTRLLQDSLGGNSKTVMVANIGPASYNYEETCNTLRYADRAKQIKNIPKINEDPKDAMLREFQAEIARLRSQLQKKGGPSVPRHRTSTGDDHDSDDSYDSDDEVGEMKRKLQKEKDELMNNQTLHRNEKQRLLAEADSKFQEIQEREEAKLELSKKIQKLESKLLIGGIPIDVRTVEQERELERKRQIIAQSQQEEQELKQTYYKEEEEVLLLNRKFASQQEEVDVKTRKLKKLFNKLQLMKQELEEVANEQAMERNELQETQMELSRDLKLCSLIIDSFIPIQTKQRVESRAVFQPETGEWRLSQSQNPSLATCRRPVSAYGKNKRPQSAYSRMAAQINGNPRYRHGNILQVEIDLPTRTTNDFIEGGAGISAPNLELFNQSNSAEVDILEVEAPPDVFQRRDIRPSRIPRKPQPSTGSSSIAYPQSRGRIKR